MQALGILIVAAIVFLLCWIVDKLFSKLFRSKAQQRSGMAVRANKRYGVFGVILSVLGILGIVAGVRGEKLLLWCGIIVLLMGGALAVTGRAICCAALQERARSIASVRS